MILIFFFYGTGHVEVTTIIKKKKIRRTKETIKEA